MGVGSIVSRIALYVGAGLSPVVLYQVTLYQPPRGGLIYAVAGKRKKPNRAATPPADYEEGRGFPGCTPTRSPSGKQTNHHTLDRALHLCSENKLIFIQKKAVNADCRFAVNPLFHVLLDTPDYQALRREARSKGGGYVRTGQVKVYMHCHKNPSGSRVLAVKATISKFDPSGG